MDTVGKRLKKMRGEMRQDDFADRIGINKNTLRAYEKDRNSPTIDTILSISEKLDVSVAWLAFGNATMCQGETTKQPHRPQETGGPCTRCERLEADNRELVHDYRELVKENRELMRENGDLRVELERMKARAAPDQETPNEAHRKAG